MPPKKTPLWKAIATSLKQDMNERRYRAGDRLPTESELADRFGVNRHTVRHAIKALSDEGIVRSRRGSGVYITAAPTDYPIGPRVRFHQNILAAGHLPEKRVLQIEERGATREEAELLEIPAFTPICVYHGVSLASGQPVALSEALFPSNRLIGIAEALAEAKGVTEALRACGVEDYTRRSTRISARNATATQALHLHVEEGEALVYTTGLNVDKSGVPVEFGRTWFAGPRVTLTLEDEQQ